MFNINKKINTSMIANTREIIHSSKNSHRYKENNYIQSIEKKSKVNIQTRTLVTKPTKPPVPVNHFENNVYNYDNINDIIVFMKHNRDKIYAYVICGVGDFICIDYFLYFKNIHFIFVSKSSLLLKTLLMETEKHNKNNTRHFAVYFNFDILNRPGFSNVNEMFNYVPNLKILNTISKIKIVDIKLFHHIKKNIINTKINIQLYNQNNRFLKTTYCNVKQQFSLPDNIFLICPYTRDNRVDCILCNNKHTEIYNCIATRNFTINDYYNTEKILTKNKMIGVIVTDMQYNLPDSINNSFINLSGKTSIEESIEILKSCHGYIGIDSFLSVVASKIFDNNNVFIKCYNKHGYDWKDLYWYENIEINSNFDK
jgi:hypothetical protein